MLQSLLAQAQAYSVPEIIAVVAAVLYLLLAIRQNIFCWLFAAISTLLYVYLFVEARLYMESALNVFYFVMAVYGWTVWRRPADKTHALRVSTWPLALHAPAIAIVAVLSLASGWLLARYTNAVYPYVDSLTSWASIWATFLVARKILENWWYWLLIDAASVLIFWSRDMQLTAFLYVAYIVMIPIGYISWSRSRQRIGA